MKTIGTRTKSRTPGKWLLVPPGWKGPYPTGFSAENTVRLPGLDGWILSRILGSTNYVSRARVALGLRVN